MASCFIQTSDFEFPLADIEETAARGGLLSMEIEFSLRCNYRCPYCYVPRNPDVSRELSRSEIKDVIRQAQALGARKIIILGGEPSIYPHLIEMIDFIRGRGMAVEMFTNGSGITSVLAADLAGRSVRVVLKMNSFDETTQDRLTGVKGSYRQIRESLDRLRQAGYPAEDRFLAVSTVICRDNRHEIVAMWQWLRDRGIAPYFEIITPQANAAEHPELACPVRRTGAALLRRRPPGPGTLRPCVGAPAAFAGPQMPAAPLLLPGHGPGRRAALRGRDPGRGQYPRNAPGRHPARERGHTELEAPPRDHQGTLPGVRPGGGMLWLPGGRLPDDRRLSGLGPPVLEEQPHGQLIRLTFIGKTVKLACFFSLSGRFSWPTTPYPAFTMQHTKNRQNARSTSRRHPLCVSCRLLCP